MKIYEATIDDREIKDTHDVTLVVLETANEKSLYEDGSYDELLEETGYEDDDIFYYIDAEDIPTENGGEIAEGDDYDFFSIISTVPVADY